MLPQDLLGGVVVEVVEVATGPSALPSRLKASVDRRPDTRSAGPSAVVADCQITS